MEELEVIPSPYQKFKHSNGAYYAWVLTAPQMLMVDAPLDDPCLLYTSPSPRDGLLSRMPSSA